MASAEHEPITGVWGQSPQRGPGAEPLVRGSEWSQSELSTWVDDTELHAAASSSCDPVKLKVFWSLDVQRSQQI